MGMFLIHTGTNLSLHIISELFFTNICISPVNTSSNAAPTRRVMMSLLTSADHLLKVMLKPGYVNGINPRQKAGRVDNSDKQ